MLKKDMSRRRLLKMLGIGVGGTVLAACQPKVVKETVVVEKEVEKEVTRVVEKVKDVTLIRWHHRLGGWNVYTERIEAFEEAHPDVKVNEEEFPAGSDEYGPKIASLVAAGMVGDLTWTAIGSGSFQFLSLNDALAPIDELVNADSSGFSLDEYYPNAIEGFRFGPEGVGDGELYGLPELINPGAGCLFFNKTMLEEEGLETPEMDWSLDQLLSMAKAVAEGDDRFGFQPETGGWDGKRRWALAFGGDLLDEEGKTSLITDENTKRAMRWVWDCFYTHDVAALPAEMSAGLNQMFLAGLMASYNTGAWGLSVKNVVKDKFEWDMVLVPKGPAGVRGGFMEADGESVTAQSENKQLAYELAKYLTDKEGGVGIALQIGLAARPDVYEDERITSNPRLVRVGESVKNAAPYRGVDNLRKQESETTLNAIFDPLWTGDAEPTDAWFEQASAEWQEFLDKPRPS